MCAVVIIVINTEPYSCTAHLVWLLQLVVFLKDFSSAVGDYTKSGVVHELLIT